MKKIIVVLGVIIALPAFAQQKDLFPNQENSSSELEEVIIQGNRIQIPFSQTTRDIQIITQKQIEQFPAKSINEVRSEEHTSELQSLMRISYAVFCLKKTKNTIQTT